MGAKNAYKKHEEITRRKTIATRDTEKRYEKNSGAARRANGPWQDGPAKSSEVPISRRLGRFLCEARQRFGGLRISLNNGPMKNLSSVN
jgi:hypothetical protein